MTLLEGMQELRDNPRRVLVHPGSDGMLFLDKYGMLREKYSGVKHRTFPVFHINDFFSNEWSLGEKTS